MSPVPKLPGRLGIGKENYGGAADQVFFRHIADMVEKAAILRIVAIVAHHKIMTLRNLVNTGVVLRQAGNLVEDFNGFFTAIFLRQFFKKFPDLDFYAATFIVK